MKPGDQSDTKKEAEQGNVFERSQVDVDQTNFATYLVKLFGHQLASEALQKYYVGRSMVDNGKANILWKIARDRKLIAMTICNYDPDTGKKVMDYYSSPIFRDEIYPDYSLCFFGEHLLCNTDYAIGIVEKEMAAVILSVLQPEIIWLAKSGCDWTEPSVIKVFENRTVLLIPDFAFTNKNNDKTCFEEWQATMHYMRVLLNNDKIKITRLLEDNIPAEQRINNVDYADMLVKQHLFLKLGLTEMGYPIFRKSHYKPFEN